jgi:hypothetical protein
MPLSCTLLADYGSQESVAATGDYLCVRQSLAYGGSCKHSTISRGTMRLALELLCGLRQLPGVPHPQKKKCHKKKCHTQFIYVGGGLAFSLSVLYSSPHPCAVVYSSH